MIAEKEKNKQVFQPSEICSSCNAKDLQECMRIISSTLSMLLYLREGDALEYSSAKFSKLSDDLLHIETNLDIEQLADSLSHRRIIRLPV